MTTDRDNDIVATVGGRKVTHGELHKAFRKVQDKEHWKNPVNCVVELTEDEQAVTYEAIVYFTGSEPSFDPVGKGKRRGALRVNVRAAGYYRTIGA